jgi:membrane protease YdiL (CAAX protease family)
VETTEHGAPGGPDRDLAGRAEVIIFAVLFEAGLAPVALALGWLLGAPPLADFRWDARDAALGAVATLPLVGLLVLSRRWRFGPLERIKRFFDREIRPYLDGRPWPDLALVCLAAGVGEEMLFRGALQGAFSRWLGPGAGLAATSLLFGLLHPITPAYAVLAALIGAYLGGVWMANGNLLSVMVAHALYDFLALQILLHDPPADDVPRP